MIISQYTKLPFHMERNMCYMMIYMNEPSDFSKFTGSYIHAY